jgi:hypothetical protein
MVRGPICGQTNPGHVHTPGPTGCNDAADPNHPALEIELTGPRPLGMRPKTRGTAKPKVVSERETTKRKRSPADAVANLTKPSSAIVQQLQKAIDEVKNQNKQFETSKKAKDEPLRLKKEKVVKDVVKAFGVGLRFVSGLEFSNRDSPENHAETVGTFITVFDIILVNAPFIASVIIHESSHAQRNAELKSAGIDESKLGYKEGDAWSALKEYEGAQLEIDSAVTTGITQDEIKAAQSLVNTHLKDIALLLGDDARKEVESGGLDNVRNRFISRLKSRP